MRKLINLYIRFIQKILVTILLTLTYFLVFSIIWLIMLFIPTNQKDPKNSYWKNAEGYETDMQSATIQS